MKSFIAGLFVVFSTLSFACEPNIQLDGTETVTQCSNQGSNCLSATEQLSEYANRIPGSNDPDKLIITVQSSPWRIYDSEMRIIESPDFLQLIRSALKPNITKIVLVGSWTGTKVSNNQSLTSQLSKNLENIQVDGFDGFVWLSSKGKIRTTKNKFTIFRSGVYRINLGSEIMASLTVGWATSFENQFISNRNAEGLLIAGVGQDAFMLCPEHALKNFEASAAMGNKIAAYNAAIMLLDTRTPNNIQKAKSLLLQAAKSGDKKSQAKLATIL